MLLRNLIPIGVALLIAICVVCPVGNAQEAVGEKPETGFLNFSSTVQGEERAGAVYIPPEYTPSTKYPLIVFLHGSGERGSDGIEQTKAGLGNAIRKDPDRFPCIVYMPQCPNNLKWDSSQPKGTLSSHDFITAGMDEIIKRYSIDEDRVYLTGLSMGGRGTYVYGAQNTDKFAAFIVICGRGAKREAIALATKPLWIFHGEADGVVPFKASVYAVDAIRENGGEVKFTPYPGVGHNAWDKAYSKSQGAIEWLLEQRK